MTSSKPPTVEPDIVTSLGALATALGMSRRQLVRLRHQGLPGADKCYSISAAKAWLEARGHQGKPKGETAKLRAELLRADIDFRRSRAATQKLELQVRRGQLIALADVERERVARILEVRQALESLGAAVVPQLVGLPIEEQIDVIDEHVRLILERFSRAGASRRQIGRGPGRPRTHEATVAHTEPPAP